MFTPSNDDKKLDWMYKGASSLIDREEYLLGKCVDKTLEQAQVAEKQAQKGTVQPPKNHVEHECIPPSIRDYKQQIGEQVDLQAKLQEDPLVAIRKREEEARKKFLQNPVQLKKIQKALKEKDKGKRKSSKKKKKKKKKSRSSDDSDDDLDAKLAEKLAKFKSSDLGTEEENFNAMLALKFSVLKDKLSERDFDEIMEGKIDDSDLEEQMVKENSDDDELPTKMKQKKRNYNNISSEDERKTNKSRKKMSVSPNRSSSDKRKDRIAEKQKYKRRNRSSSCDDDKERVIKSKRSARQSRSSDRKISKERRYERSEKKKRENSKTVNSKKKRRDDKSRRRSSSSSKSSVSSADNKKRSSIENRREKKKQSPTYSPVQKEHIIRKYNSDSDEIVEEKRNYGLVNADGSKLSKGSKSSRENVQRAQKKEAEKPIYKPEQRKRLTEEEKEKLRKEMADNAVWRCRDREKNLRKYREEDEKEVMERKDYDPDFMQKQLIKSTSSSTVESRIKSNINNIQRSSQSMNTNFSRK